MIEFGKQLRRRTRELGLTDAAAARHMGLDQRRYSNYVLGHREPDLALLIKICRTLKLSPNEALGWDENPKNVKNTREKLKIRLSALAANLPERDLRIAVRQIEAFLR